MTLIDGKYFIAVNNSNKIENIDYQTINLLTSKNISENLKTFVN